MKKTIYIVTITIITVLCIIGGSIYHILGWMGSIFDFGDWSWGGSFLDHSRVTYSEDLPDFEEIHLDCSVMDITIETGDTFHLSFDCVAYLVPDVNVIDGTLRLKQPSVPHFGGSNNHCDMTLTIPSDVALSTSNISLDVGDIRLSDITFQKKCTIKTDVGDLRIQNCTFADAELESDVGDIRLEDSELITSEINADVGDVKLTECTFGYLNISGDVGDITVESGSDLSEYPMEFSCDFGNVTVNGRNHKRYFSQDGSLTKSGLYLENSVGDIKVEYK